MSVVQEIMEVRDQRIADADAEAVERLEDREKKLRAVVDGGKSELTELAAALRKLKSRRRADQSSRASASPSSPGSPARERKPAVNTDDKKERIREALRTADHPLTLREIATSAQMSGQGLYPLLSAMRRKGEVIPQDGAWSILNGASGRMAAAVAAVADEDHPDDAA